MRPIQRAAGATCLAAVAGCSELPFGTGCEATVHRAVDVEVRDARTGRSLAAGARGAITDGPYLDTLMVVGWRGDTATTLGAGLGRAGTYTVRVRHAGYALWEQRGVRARSGRCGVRTTRVTARLAPSG